MKQFLKFVLATMVGFILLLGILFLVGASAVSNLGKDKEVSIKEKSVLHLKLDYELNDRTSDNPFERFAALANETSAPVGLYDLITYIGKAKEDEKISGLFLDLTLINAGYAKTLELRKALADFKESGKFIYAYAENYTNKTYFLASVADKVYMNPKGNFLFNGMLSQVTFVTEMLDKIGVEMQVVKRGKFKGAVEPFVLDGLSPENRLQIESYVNSLFDEMIGNIAASRGLTADSLKGIADRFAVRNAEQAFASGMIDGSKFRDEVLDEIKGKLELKEDEKPAYLDMSKYIAAVRINGKKDKDSEADEQVAIIYADGSIISGNGDEESIGSDKFARAIRQARENDKVKAVVLRVNSPGGSALASEVILREVYLLKQEKPVIVSMGDVAASGGYYISCLADSILAQPNTLTGSIGVFGLIPNAEDMLEKIGVRMDYVGTGAMSEFGRIDRNMTPEELSIYDEYVGSVYDDFLGHVSEGRKLSVAMVDSIGQGRVWTGRMAEALGLVDAMGGMHDAVRIAAFKAGIENYEVTTYPKSKNQFEEFFTMFSTSSVRNYLLSGELGEHYELYRTAGKLQKMDGVQAILPYRIEVR
ncbi:MAG: signal peptide peptidase SppA [Flavobacteriales bacterium]|nr:signal peptide peptidase SppA [Flavobacteriales bacterium]